MKQELITQFCVKTSGLFTLEDSLQIQKLLQKASDDAFPVLMAHKVSLNPILKYPLWVVFSLALIMFVVGIVTTIVFAAHPKSEDFTISLCIMIVSAIIMLVTFICTRFLKPTKSRAYEDYSKILLKYQQ